MAKRGVVYQKAGDVLLSGMLLTLSVAALFVAMAGTSMAEDDEALTMTSRQFLEAELDSLTLLSENKKERIDLIDAQLRTVSIALALGDRKVARELLVDTTTYFETLLSDEDVIATARKSRRALLGKGASEKYFLGDPYEQLFAFVYLGLLDLEARDFDYARASFAQASYADKGSSAEGQDVDCYMAFLLEGLANRALGRKGEAREAFGFASRAFRFREVAAVVNGAFDQAHKAFVRTDALKPPNSKPKVVANYNVRKDTLYLVAYEQATLAAIVNESAQQAVRDTFSVARTNLEDAEKKSTYAQYLDTFSGNKKSSLTAGLALLSQYESMVLARITDALVSSAERRTEDFDVLIETLTDPKVNTIIVHQRGRGPAKYRRGSMGQGVAYNHHLLKKGTRVTSISTADGELVELLQPAFLESVDYQATTRGAVEMEAILEKRVSMRQRLAAASGGLAMFGAMFGDSIIGAVADIAALGTKLAANAANVESDVRGWHELPKEFLISAHSLEPGRYTIQSHTFDDFARDLDGQSSKIEFTVTDTPYNFVFVGTHWEK